MDRQAQIDFILDHYENPRHYGALADADASAQGVNPGCGDVVTIYLRADGDGRIEAMSFEGEGCTISQAGASIVTEMFTGKTLTDVEDDDGRSDPGVAGPRDSRHPTEMRGVGVEHGEGSGAAIASNVRTHNHKRKRPKNRRGGCLLCTTLEGQRICNRKAGWRALRRSSPPLQR